jgi:pyrroloquinoline quinone (PQQ) biosynthesis protein C
MHRIAKAFIAGLIVMSFGASAALADDADDQARRIVARLRVELAPIEDQIRNVPYLPALERGEVSLENLKAFAGEQYHISKSDLRSAAQMVARYGGTPSGDFFQSVVDSETIVRGLLLDFARALGMTEADLKNYEPRPLAQTYPHYVTWLSVNGTDSDMAAAFLVNFPVFGENVGRMGAALRAQYGFTAEQTAYFEFLSFLPDSFKEDALDTIAAGIRRGDARRREIRRSVRLLQAYELDFWTAVGQD